MNYGNIKECDIADGPGVKGNIVCVWLPSSL